MTYAGKWCGRCTQPIGPDEEYTEHPMDGATGAGSVIYWHADPCPASPQQTSLYETRWRRSRRR
ncbi:hypothetical protein [Streptomyces sp. enrichment culture]|uniref:hypothetical protein n=1 Tax=Streptomyces sp. enrichment culture TaxID=1795815 RepID=UPI003F54D649